MMINYSIDEWFADFAVQEAVGIELVSEPTSSSTLAAMFVVDAKVLYQLCSFGMADVDEVVDLYLW